MVGNWILNDLQKFFLRICRANGEAVEELDHETCKSLKGTWNSDGRADLDKDTFGSMNVDLKFTCFVDR